MPLRKSRRIVAIVNVSSTANMDVALDVGYPPVIPARTYAHARTYTYL